MFTYNTIRKGDAHDFFGKPCQDFVFTNSVNDVVCTALADGVSSCRCGGEIAEALTKTISHIFASNFSAYCKKSDEQLREEVVSCIRAEQRELAEKYAKKGEAITIADMGCTLALVAYNKRTRQYIALNLGDGVILARRTGWENAEMLMQPVRVNMNGRELPVVTVYEGSMISAYINIRRGAGYDAFMLSSDGLQDVFYGLDGAVSESVGALMYHLVDDPHGVRSFLPAALDKLSREDEVSLDDDISIGMLVHCPPQPSTFIDRNKPSISGKFKRKAYQYSVYGEEIYSHRCKKLACKKAGISMKDKHEWHNLQSHLRAVGYDE